MVLKGDVQSLNLGSIIQNLATDEKTGTLTLEQKDREIHLWFENGQVRLLGLGNSLGPSALNGLIALQYVPHEDLSGETQIRRGEAGLIRKVCRKHKVKKEQVREALSHQIIEYLCEAFTWKEARYEFDEGEPDDEKFDVGQLDMDVKLGAEVLVMEAARRTDEWQETRKAIVTSTEILIPAVDEPPADSEPTELRIWDLLNGERSVRDIMKWTRLGPFAVYKALATLRRKGAVRHIQADDALERAKKHGKAKRYEQALRLVNYGLEREPNNHDLRKYAAFCYEFLGNTKEAISQYRRVAAALVEDEKHQEALDIYKKVVELAPGDLHGHEKILELLMTMKRKEDTLRALEGFARAAKKAGLPDKVRDTYQRVMDTYGEDRQMIESLAEMERYLGDGKGAVQLYRKLLQGSMKEKDDGAALEYSRIILRIDPTQRDIVRTRQKLESGELQKSRERKRFWKILASIAVILLVIGLLGGYEIGARLDLAAARPQIDDAKTNNRHDEALDLFDAFLHSWSWSLAAKEAKEERGRLEKKYIETLLDQADRYAERGQVLNALESVHQASTYARDEELITAVDNKHKALEKLKETEETRRSKKIRELCEKIRGGSDPNAASELAGMNDPFAVAGLRKCLSDANTDVRRSTVIALAGTKGHAATGALIEALAIPEDSIKRIALNELKSRTGEDFGEDRAAWDKWYRLQKPGPVATFQALLQPAKEKISSDEEAGMGWRLTNLGVSSVEFTLAPPLSRLQVTGPDGKGLTINGKYDEMRSALLGPGEYIGGGFNLRDVFPDMKKPGNYRIEWSVAVTINGNEQVIAAGAVVIEILGPKKGD